MHSDSVDIALSNQRHTLLRAVVLASPNLVYRIDMPKFSNARSVLRYVRQQARRSQADIAKAVDLSPSTISLSIRSDKLLVSSLPS